MGHLEQPFFRTSVLQFFSSGFLEGLFSFLQDSAKPSPIIVKTTSFRISNSANTLARMVKNQTDLFWSKKGKKNGLKMPENT